MSKHFTVSPNEAADRLAIRELVEAYAHCADRRDANGQMSLFTADTHFVVYMNAKDPQPYYIDKLRELAPRAVIRIQSLDKPILPITDPSVDAVFLPAERGAAWTLMFPEYAVVVPGPEPIGVPLAFPIGKRDERFARFLNTWIALKRKDATLDAAYKRWILGQDVAAREPLVDHSQRTALG